MNLADHYPDRANPQEIAKLELVRLRSTVSISALTNKDISSNVRLPEHKTKTKRLL